MGQIKEFITNFVVTHDDQEACAADKCVCHTEGGATYISVALEVKGRNIVACT